MKSLSVRASILTLSKILALLINLIVTMLLSRYRTFEEYGTFSQLNIVSNIVASLFALGLPMSINYFLNKTKDCGERRTFLSAYFSMGSLLGIVIAIFLVVLYPFIVKFFDNHILYTYEFVMVALPWVMIFNSSAENLFVAYNKIGILVSYRLSYSFLMLAVAAVFSVCKWTFHSYMIVYIVVQVIYILYLYGFAYWVTGGIKISFNIETIKEIFLYSIPLGVSAIISTLNIQLDNLMVGNLFDTETLAIYSNMSNELPLNMLTVSITTVIIPLMVFLLNNSRQREAIRLWNVSIRMCSILICFVSAALFVYSESIITIMYSEKYVSGCSVFRVYAITSLVKITSWGIVLNATRNNKKILYISILTLFLNMILNFILMRAIGVVGAALSTMCSEFFGIALKLYFSAKSTNFRFKDIIDWKSLMLIMLVNVALASFAMIFYKIMGMYCTMDFVNLIVSGILWFAIYFLVMKNKFFSLWKELNDFEKLGDS